MKILTVVARLLDYPTELIQQHQAEILEAIAQEDRLSRQTKQAMFAFLEERLGMDLLDWQSDYDALFERGRNLSLLLFEHVHGESRDRGQAMVDLIEQYKAAGLEIGVKELPDYLPLFLEFIATQDEADAKAWLNDVSHILALLLARLEDRDEAYARLFSALVDISEAELDIRTVKEAVAKEDRDDTQEAIDRVWEEESVSFGGDAVNGGCPTSQHRPSEAQSRIHDMPVTILDPNASLGTHANTLMQ